MKQPAILRKRITRGALGVIGIGLLAFVFFKFVSGAKDLDPGVFESAGYIAALKESEDGEQAVLISPTGAVNLSPDYSEGVNDQAPVWTRDGNRVYFSSDRDEESHVYRWNEPRNAVERMTIDKRTKSGVVFDAADPNATDPTCLVISGGTVIVLDPTKKLSRQILPPGKASSEGTEEQGATTQFEQIYTGIGTSVRQARWSRDREYLLVVMRREDGEILIAQKMGKVPRPVDATDLYRVDFSKPPIAIVAGDRIDFDVSPLDGLVVFTCMGFQFPDPKMIPPEMKENGKIKLPFRHVLGIYRPGDGGMYEPSQTAQSFVALGPDDEFCFASPKISPDGAEFVAVVGKYEGSGLMQPNNLVLMPFTPRGGEKAVTLSSAGNISDPSWHPNGQTILFVSRVDGKRAIFSVNRDRSGLKRISPEGNFRAPSYSPLSK